MIWCAQWCYRRLREMLAVTSLVGCAQAPDPAPPQLDAGLATPPRLPQEAGMELDVWDARARFTQLDLRRELGARDPLGSDPLFEHCEAVPEAAFAPTTIDAVVASINQLHKPLTLACFLRSLKRPLRLVPVRSSISAQPAVGARSPRIFLFFGQLVLSIVPEGVGQHLLEMSFLLSDTRSIKAELEFPIREPVPLTEAYESTLFSSITTCAQCHAREVEVSGFGFERAFASEALRPQPSQVLGLGLLAREALGCDLYADGERCAMLHALMLYGEVELHSFPEAMPLFGQ